MTTAQDSARGRTAVVTAGAGAIGTAITQSMARGRTLCRPLRGAEKIAPGRSAGELPEPSSKARVDIDAWHCSVGDAVPAPPPRSQATARAVNGADLPSCVAPLWRITSIR